MKTTLKRFFRVAAFSLGAAITGLGAGSVVGMDIVQSALFGALLGVLGIIAAISFIFAGKGGVNDADFDAPRYSAIETVRSKEK